MDALKNRKNTRLKGADYNRNQAVFLTICTKERVCILSHVVGTGVLDGPRIELTKYGQIADKYIHQLNDFYDDLSVESYVILPIHIHIMLWVKGVENGPSRTPVPTVQNSIPSRFVSTFKRFCNKEYGINIWQYRSNDHIIRNRQDYEEHLRYSPDECLYFYRQFIFYHPDLSIKLILPPRFLWKVGMPTNPYTIGVAGRCDVRRRWFTTPTLSPA